MFRIATSWRSGLAALLTLFLAGPAMAACPPDTFVHASDFRLGDYDSTQANDNFGHAVATDGQVMAVGVPRHDTAASLGGAVYLFTRGATPGDWQYLKRLLEPHAAESGDRFGAALDAQDDVLVVGAPDGGDTNANDAGLVDVFERNQGQVGFWGVRQEIVAQESAGYRDFGSAVALQGDRLLVGDPLAGGGDGRVVVYQRGSSGLFAEVATLSNPDSGGLNHFGEQLALFGDVAVVSDPAFDADPGRSGLEGRVWVYARDQGGAGQWGLVTRLQPNPAATDSFGTAVSISHDRIAVGTGAPGAGRVYLFGRDVGGSSHWGQIESFTAPAGDTGASDGFGLALDLHKWELLVGAGSVFGAEASTGAAYVYHRVPQSSPEHWMLLQKFYSASNNYRSNFGVALDWGHGFAAIGDPLSDDPSFPAGSKVGHAYVFFDDEIMCTPFE